MPTQSYREWFLFLSPVPGTRNKEHAIAWGVFISRVELKRWNMKRIALNIGLVALTLLGGSGLASAQGFGVYVGPDHPYYGHHRHWRGDYAYAPGCRVVVRTHTNRWGNRVTIRERICD